MAETAEPVPQGDVVRKEAQQPEEARIEDKGSGQSCPAESGVPAATFSPPPPWTKGRGDRPESDRRRSERPREWEQNIRSRGVSSDSQSKRGRQESSEQGRSPVRSGERGLRNQPVRLGRTSRSPGQTGKGSRGKPRSATHSPAPPWKGREGGPGAREMPGQLPERPPISRPQSRNTRRSPSSSPERRAHPGGGRSQVFGSASAVGQERAGPRTLKYAKHAKGCFICEKEGHFAKNCPNLPMGSTDRQCHYCGEFGHIPLDCRHPDHLERTNALRAKAHHGLRRPTATLKLHCPATRI